MRILPHAGIQFIAPGIVDRRVERPPESPAHDFRPEIPVVGERNDAGIGLSHQTGFQPGNIFCIWAVLRAFSSEDALFWI